MKPRRAGWLWIVVCLMTLVILSPAGAHAATLTSFSATPADPTANSSAGNTYTLGFSGTSGTAAKCIVAAFEANNGTVPVPSQAAWQYQGGSTTDGSTITLTTPSQSFTGSIGAYEGAVPSEGLHATFDGYIGGGGGADGMTFSLLDPLAYGGFAGSSGAGLGYSGLTGVAVTMRTSWDGSVGSSNFMGIATSGSGSSITYASTNTGVANLRTTHSYDVTVSSGHLIVKLDGTQVLNSAVTLPATVYPAFTAGTGSVTDTHSVTNIAISYTGGGVSGTSVGLPPGMTISGSSGSLTGSTAVTAANWGNGTTNQDQIAWTYSTGQVVSAGTLMINGIMHNPAASGTYYVRLTTYSDTFCSVPIDSNVAAFAITDAMTVSAIVDPVLTFSVAGYNSGSCNGSTINTSANTSTAVPLGHANMATNVIGGQTLSITTNAASGYTVYASDSGQLGDGNGHTIANWSGTNANPTTFPSAGTEAFGYTTDHNLSSAGAGTTRFQSNKWAALSTSGAEIAYQPTGYVADVTHVCYQVGIAASTPAAAYSTTVTYTAVPVY